MLTMIENFLHDLRFALRWMAKRPALTLAAILSLALGIGANTTIFSVVNELFLRPLPVEEPHRLVSIYTRDVKNPGYSAVSHLNWLDLRRDAEVFSEVVAYDWVGLGITGGEESQVVVGQMVSDDYFSTLGVEPLRGRFFTAGEGDTPGSPPVAVLSHGFWIRSLGADEGILAQTLTVNGQPVTVVGIARPEFRGTDTGIRPELWLPMSMNTVLRSDPDTNWYEERRGLFLNVVARLAPGVTVEQAEARLAALGERLEADFPDDNKGRSFTLVPLPQASIHPEMRGVVARGTTLLMVIVGLVLLIACANVANLLLARASERRREIATRLALGAEHGRLIRQLLTESVLIAGLGAGLGLVLAGIARSLLLGILPSLNFPVTLALDLRLDGRVLAFTLVVAVGTGILFGLAPALQATRTDLVTAIREQTGETPRRFLPWLETRRVLVIAQVALSVVALLGAGWFLESLRAAQSIDPGFDAEKLAVASFDTGLVGYDRPRSEQLYDQVLDRLRRLPGVKAASLAQAGPLQPSLMRSLFLEGQDPESDRTFVMVNSVSEDYFETLGLTFEEGRGFESWDRPGAVPVVIVNRAMAERYWPAEEALGKRFTFFGFEQPVEVAGVVADSKVLNLGEEPRPVAYLPLTQQYTNAVTAVVRTDGTPGDLLPGLRRELMALAPSLPLAGVGTVTETLRGSLWASRFAAWFLGLFAALALVLAIIGLYGVLAHGVVGRSREIGLRMAIGADRRDVLWLVSRQGLVLVLAGMILGGLAAWLAGGWVRGMLFVSPTEPLPYLVVAFTLLFSAGLATFLPARRATTVEPVSVLRYD